jgi:hypothetical protein
VSDTDTKVLREIAALHNAGIKRFQANTLAERLWPEGRHHNANGQVFHLGSAIAARLLRKCPAVQETEFRIWEILPHRLPSNTTAGEVPMPDHLTITLRAPTETAAADQQEGQGDA